MSRGRGAAPSRVGSFFVGLGFCTVLAVTFLVGLFAGRQWPRLLPWVGAAGVAAEAPGRRGPERAAPARTPEPPLTFYQELTAPLEPRAPGRPGQTQRPAAPGPEARPARASGPAAGPPPSQTGVVAASPDAGSATRYTVQVAAFKARAPAAALSARLAAAGWDAYLSEAGGADGARYRVRVGAFSSREAAHEAAQRLAAAERLRPYVTLR